jgi:hypothetical protein
MANAADHVTLSTGQILFADPSLPWTPANFPSLPPTALSLTAAGTIAGRDINTLTLPNVITYQNYESAPLRPPLIKSLVVNSSGDVAYDDPKVSLVSTNLSAYNVGITGFGSPAIGAPGISSSPADTLTNAVAKLDGWITQNLLSQPPAVNPVETENTSLYAGVRWNNYPVYNILQYSVPTTTGIVLILGDPSSSDYLTLELTNTTWFPDRQYTDGLASDFYPVVRLRIYNDAFLSSADALYSKAYMQASCVKIISENGIYTLPSTGKVFAVQNSVAGETYTTISLYLPQIPTATQIPVRIVYINKTQTSPNVALAYTSTTSFGAPSAPASVQQFVSSQTSFTLKVAQPVYSDETHNVSSCFFSSYNVQYTAKQYNIAHSGNVGFRYGQATPALTDPYLSSYTNSTFTRITPVESGPYQDIIVSGANNFAVIPGIQWSTSIYATNSAQLIGSTIAGPNPVVSAFPCSITQCISSASLSLTSPWVVPAGSNGLAYINYNNGWNLGDPVSTNIVFLASSQVTKFGVNGNVQFNDPSFPGCRSNITVYSLFNDIDNEPQVLTHTLTVTADDFILNTTTGVAENDSYISTIIIDPQTNPAYQKFLYDVTLTGGRIISTISDSPQTLAVALDNFKITGFTDPIIQQNFSTIPYVFMTEPVSTFNTSTIAFASTATGVVQISGLYTPTTSSKLYFDLYTSNFVFDYANFSSFAMSQLYFNGIPAGPVVKHTSSLHIYMDGTEVNTIPLPGNSALTLSSLHALLTSNIYMDPSDPHGIEIYASATPANPLATTSMQPYNIGSTMYIDTVSQPLYSTFTNASSSNGLRVLSLLPRYESPGTANNMNDGINAGGIASNGLDTSVSSFFIMGYTNNLTVSTSAVYNNTSSLSATYTNPYSRELLFTNGFYTHPGGLDFSQFNGTPLGIPSASYPNFSTDLSADVNYGNRYASFLYNARSNVVPTNYQFVNIRVRNPSALSTITNSRDYNYAFPDIPIPDSNMQYSKVRMHMKIVGAYNAGSYLPLETAWINCLKAIDYNNFDDSVFDVGGCVAVSTSGADIWYKVQMDRRAFTSVYPIIRVGISRDGSAEVLPADGDYLPITFNGMNIEVTDF